MKKISISLCLFLLVKLSLAQVAPYTIQNSGGWIGGGLFAGSSFLTLGAGQIDSITVINRTSSTYADDTLYIFSGNTTNISSLIYKQSIGPVPGNYGADVIMRLTNPVQVTAGTTYTFYVFGFPIQYGASDTYANGTYWDDSGEHTGSDLDFTMYIGTSTGVTGIVNAVDENFILYKSAERKIEAVVQISGDCQLMLFDMQGNKIAFSADKQLTLPSAVTDGIYMVKLQSGNMVYTRKIYVR
jgi:hypothetical protein